VAGAHRGALRRRAGGARLQRGERVHAAMLARGYDGRMPATGLEAPARPLAWAAALALPAVAVAATIAVRGLA